jgi:hypothetical protein
MKQVSLMCTYTITCTGTVEVPDDFEFESDDPDERADELESVLEDTLESYLEEPNVDDSEFDGWIDVSIV